ncbi:MAG: polyprenyl synthetase family protein [Candidatus Eremiobacteraeota bacterium]|nr:polyprenyl synthetase family protein [Candidatus Eremiobacteraeota bacterium]
MSAPMLDGVLASFERRLLERTEEHRSGDLLREAIAYHFGFGEFGPTRVGKRLRPQLLFRTAFQLGAPVEATLDAAVAVEILHNYSLVHDDIEDRDELRHGRPTLWARYGIAQAINAGDAMCAISFLALTQSGAHLGAQGALSAVRRLHEAHRAMCDGQARDIAFESRDAVAFEEYLEMIAGKTAALFGAACELGAICAAADATTAERARGFGREYGMAFQIRDDLLGVWGDEVETGKRVAGDLARRKWSFPIVWALAQPDSAARRTVAATYASGRSLDLHEVEAVRRALDELAARPACERAIAQRLESLQRFGDGDLYRFAADSLR